MDRLGAWLHVRNEGKKGEGNDDPRVWLRSPVYIRGTHQPKEYVCVRSGELEWRWRF